MTPPENRASHFHARRVLLAGTRNNGLCPCHRCLVTQGDLANLGAPTDVERDSPRKEADILKLTELAQQEITKNGFAVDSDSKVEVHLKPQSLVPSRVCLFPCLTHDDTDTF